MVISCKEVLRLPREVIEDRFHLEGDEGAALEFFGDAVAGVAGSAFVYTNRETLSVGLGIPLDAATRRGIRPDDLLARFKAHPCVRSLLRGGEVAEYAAHLIPEAGYHGVGPLSRPGLLLAGDAAGLVNTSLFHEGSSLAVASGEMAAETVAEARAASDFSADALGAYDRRMARSFVMQDLRQFRRAPEFLRSSPRFFDEYPDVVLSLARRYFTVSEEPKASNERAMVHEFLRRVGIFRGALDAFRLWRAFG
jgi:electron transfer flavoprotein-quinone oxidoreductase